MTFRGGLPRRRFLRGIGSAITVGTVAGCSGRPDSPAETTTGTTSNSRLDLREANVVDVSVGSSDGDYTFDVTLDHDDDGESGYANWWQVERLDGTRLGRRELLHAHSQQPFTRSETIAIPAEVSCVVVRGHDETHEYGGQVLTVDLDSGETRAVNQGPEPRSVDEHDSP
jgi:hypothetical protein